MPLATPMWGVNTGGQHPQYEVPAYVPWQVNSRGVGASGDTAARGVRPRLREIEKRPLSSSPSGPLPESVVLRRAQPSF